ncbi:hypothetical protein [Methylacidimicrobium sp. B4]|uniref:hypothetical protein n=1 Tax=Methylacidimicrobium sp. B4 TaxID=2796139 RepID=UPI001A8E95C5|nr:hypothetical protein [Methylacidimicrobium sp. B4]QSR84319.1 hypothetical protein MacB4_08825 [Methylacidimicrobium sp. B4]
MKGRQESETKLNEQLRIFFGHRLAEKATPEYFEGMLGQVHRRLRQELVGRPRWWDRLAELIAPSLPEVRPLLVRLALPAVLFAAVVGFALQHERLTPAARQVALATSPSPAHLVSTGPDLLWNLRGDGEPSIVAPRAASGVGEERTTKAKDRENGGRSFVSVLPVRYEASVDF